MPYLILQLRPYSFCTHLRVDVVIVPTCFPIILILMIHLKYHSMIKINYRFVLKIK